MAYFVQIESPYAGSTDLRIRFHILYARLCMKDALERGETPVASHLLYTQPNILNDEKLDDRVRGIKAGFDVADALNATVVVYQDLGISPGMARSIDHAKEAGRPVEYRNLAFGGYLEYALEQILHALAVLEIQMEQEGLTDDSRRGW